MFLLTSQVNYLHSHGLAHTELRLENVHICPVDRHIKVSQSTSNPNCKRKHLILYKCVGFMMAKMVLKELMDPSTFTKFKLFLNKRRRLAYLIELMELLNPHPKLKVTFLFDFLSV
ncbi:hypothetical protein MA16_Dca023654 [Dendrobium catenatum]|uniref:Uncharacterized protein n=1 Tax=Dendrobium catenatum TaxID=906689 RepID=A0A2I0VXH7_9ASPA|nr:hypothetical protein MA16_Dca023654 [Dendrobium catenatum]